MENEQKLENYLKKKILPDLEKSRGGFDRIHTLEVVSWLKKIIDHNPDLNLDRTVLLIAAYAHDWGYSEIFPEGQTMTFDLVEDAKSLHMKLGAEKVKNLLEDDFFDFLTKKQKDRCIHLVRVHDKKHEIDKLDELILMEADMLSALQVSEGKPVFDADSNRKFMDSFLNIRFPKFVTDFSKNKAKELMRKREEHYKS